MSQAIQPLPPSDFLPEKKRTPRVYLHIYEGRLCERRANPAPGFTRHESSKGKVSYIREYEYVQGFLTDWIRIEKETLEGNKYNVIHAVFNNGGGFEAVLEVPLKSEFVARFAKCCENIDFREMLWVAAFLDRQTRKSRIILKQRGEKVAQKYTQPNPNGLPQWEVDPITGEFDTRAYWKFLFDVIARIAIPQIADTKRALQAILESQSADMAADVEDIPPSVADDDDIPF